MVRIYRILQGAEVWRSRGDWFQRTDPAMAPEIRARLLTPSQLTATEIVEARLKAEEVRAQVSRQSMAVMLRLLRFRALQRARKPRSGFNESRMPHWPTHSRRA